MYTNFISLFTAFTMFLGGLLTPEGQLRVMFQSGTMLRLHVVAQDDTEEMQALKLLVRDAVQAAYAANCPDESATMLENTRILLPILEAAAQACAQENGFSGPVRAELGTFHFESLKLAQNSVPEGDYPALMIYMGDAKGHNWWGLIDPAVALSFARLPDAEESGLRWDWSWRGFLRALLRRPLSAKEAMTDANR